jgi:hypothetical protein
VMAYAFLKALGLKGGIGTFTVDLRRNTMKTSAGHEVISARAGAFEIKSSRYPFCACEPKGQSAPSYPVCDTDDLTQHSSIRSAQTLIPFNHDLNRLILVGRGGKAPRYKVTWGAECKSFSPEQLGRGVNLAEEFPGNPFCQAFAKVDAAVAAKQAFETRQIKEIFHGEPGKVDMEAAVASTEKERQSLVEAIQIAFQPVTHVLRIEAE